MIAKTIIFTVIGMAIVALHIYREYKWFMSLDDEDTEYAMNAMHKIFMDR